jgi:hypothetical protein
MKRKRKPGKNGRSISNVDLPPDLDEDVCLYGDVEPFDDDPTRGTCHDCGGEFKLRDGVQPADYETTEDPGDDQSSGGEDSNAREDGPSDAGGDVR